MKISKLLFITLLCYSSQNYALFCPTNFNMIEIGDSMETVIAQCGKPAKETKSEIKPNEPQEWIYFGKMDPSDEGTIKTSIAMLDDKVANMSINGISVTETEICGGNIHVGSSAKDVEAACGKPTYSDNLTKGDGKNPEKAIERVELEYSSTPAQTLVFEDGKLKEKK